MSEGQFVRDRVRSYLRRHPSWPGYRTRIGLDSRNLTWPQMDKFIDYIKLFDDAYIKLRVGAVKRTARRIWAARKAFKR